MMQQLKMIKDCLESAVAAQVTDLSNANAQELGEAVDMIKDIAEAMYYCSKIEKKNHKDEEMYVEYSGDYYSKGRDMDKQEHRMYYTESYPRHTAPHPGSTYQSWDNNGGRDEPPMRDGREGRSPTHRRTYMEAKEGHHDKAVTMQKLELYAQDLVTDVLEMLQDASPEEKSLLHKKLVALSEKVKTL